MGTVIGMETFFASPERAESDILASEIDIINSSPVMSGLLHTVNGLLAVVNEHRQVVALNDSFLKMLGIKDPSVSLGLRPGEILNCVHAHDEPAGCGTTRYCSTCGAAIAMVTSIEEGRPSEEICVLSAKANNADVELVLKVRSQCIDIEGRRFILLFLQDITLETHRAALERTFFHDLNNMLGILSGATELLAMESPSEITDIVQKAVIRLKREIDIQKFLLQRESTDYKIVLQSVSTKEIIEELNTVFSSHPLCNNRKIEFPDNYPHIRFSTDVTLLIRVLSNMIINALEATPENGVVRVSVERLYESLRFSVWNEGEIPPRIAVRIFQRNFSTKGEEGRGTGTYSMKLLGEKILKGKVTFFSSVEEGTTFTLICQLY
ncbi:MAG: HAMP domain-containing histidine kinase [Deltaproteobacteria bacterium]|nr:HAMP domain-containing histidine kinase [Deltaproteobacteria bacterium]